MSAPYAGAWLMAALVVSQADAQSRVVIHGRVEDEVSGAPVPLAIVIAVDGPRSVRTDSFGNFAIESTGSGPHVLQAAGSGYVATTFELSGPVESNVHVLLLPPLPWVEAAGLREGDRVRVASSVTAGEFTIAGLTPYSLLLRGSAGPAELEVPVASLSGLELSRGREMSLPKGLFFGATGGAFAAAVLGVQCLQTHYECLTGMSAASTVLVGVGVGAVVGLIASLRSGERWDDVRLPGAAPAGPRRDENADDAPTTVVPDVRWDEIVELIVRNQSPAPITASVWWEDGGNVLLGDIRARTARTFIVGRRGTGVAMFANLLSDPAPGPRRTRLDRSQFVPVQPGDRVEWVFLGGTSGIVEDYRRLPAR